jgi:hypothetical protein
MPDDKHRHLIPHFVAKISLTYKTEIPILPSHESKFLSIIIAAFAKENLPVLFQSNFIFDFDQENPPLCACLIFLIGKMIVKCQ